MKNKANEANIVIGILQRGWVVVGYCTEQSDCVVFDSASVIRVWGTSHGLGEIALKGPTPNTILDPCGRVKVYRETTVALIDTKTSIWKSHLK
ncbi:MAG: hypothetical protein UY96_C0017G0008 [Parcubacteria group bacterium GW2011_GWB1_56_8]|nr:MAG: hypothetical protein UY96_C0017G0008 [Parcubacteria group bacterium GW2011_GWB1_56_8]